MSAIPVLRDEREIQRAHDILEAVVRGEVNVSVDDESRAHIFGALDVLCWVLHHDHNHTFPSNLARIERAMERAGYVLRERLQ
jgi:hypothetical protein